MVSTEKGERNYLFYDRDKVIIMPPPRLDYMVLRDLFRLVMATKHETKTKINNRVGSLDGMAYDDFYEKLCSLEQVLSDAMNQLEPFKEEMGS